MTAGEPQLADWAIDRETAPSDSYDLDYHGDQDSAPGLLDLAVNVRLPAPPPWLRERLAQALDELGRYPDPGPAVEALAARHGRPPEEVLPIAGAAEAFVLLARVLQPRHAVCLHPSFTEPEAALRGHGHPVTRVILDPPFELTPRLLAELVPDDADLVVLGNPTNPTGVLHAPATLTSLVRPGRLLVVDEAFIDTVPGEVGSLASRRDLPGLVVVRSLTKTWGLAGLRVGYLLGSADVVDALAAAQPLWPVSSLALTALRACCEPSALSEAEQAAVALVPRRIAFAAELSRLPGLAVAAASRTSFLLVRVDPRIGGERLRLRLRGAGLAVRRGDTFPGLGPDYLRIAVRDEETNAYVVGAFTAALGGDL